jgi:hypothetical protein
MVSAVLRLYTLSWCSGISRVEAESNTSIVALQVVGGDEGNPMFGDITEPPCSWEI